MKINWKLVIAVIIIVGAILYLEQPAEDIERVAPAVQKKDGLPAPELAGISGYINTDNITIGELIGKKVILVDFWTYSCINCQRTLPYLTAWYEKYKDKGLEIIGVHSPEFAFEEKQENVQRAVDKFGITYPVVLDNDHATWRAFMNRYWPRKYLIDIDGYIVWDHAGEGAYDDAERKIQELLQERMERLGMEGTISEEPSDVKAPTVEFGRIGTPEIYLGYAFTRGNFGNAEGLPRDKEVAYTIPSTTKNNAVYLEGTWFVDKDHVRLASDTGKVVLKYNAKNVNIVAAGKSEATVGVDGKELQNLMIDAEDLYSLADTEYGTHQLTLDITGAGFKLYTFTFG